MFGVHHDDKIVSRRAEASRAYGSVALGLSRSVSDEFRELAEKEL